LHITATVRSATAWSRSTQDRLEIACDGARIVMTLEDIYEDTGLQLPS
jgi:hypothetical protein